MAKNILVYIEQRNGIIKKASLEAVSAAAKLGKELNYTVAAAVIGGNVEELDKISKYGIGEIAHYKNAELDLYSPSAYSKILAQHIADNDFEIVFFSNTSLGKDLAPRIGVKVNAGVALDCTKIVSENNEIIASRPVFAGKAIADIKIKSPKKIFTLRPNVFPLVETTAASNVKTTEVQNIDLRTKTKEIKKSDGKLDVAEAEIIVAGGRGLKAPENFKMIEELADLLNGAVGASRAVVDAGWRQHSEQVGQTGKTVSPTLYVAVGISGAIQHLAGMRSSKYIVAINKDKDAPIFQAADYGIAGDAFEVLPALIEEIKKLKA